MTTTPEPPTAGKAKPYSARLNGDDHIRILALRDAAFTYLQIPSSFMLLMTKFNIRVKANTLLL
jgi:hypothetical protein